MSNFSDNKKALISFDFNTEDQLAVISFLSDLHINRGPDLTFIVNASQDSALKVIELKKMLKAFSHDVQFKVKGYIEGSIVNPLLENAGKNSDEAFEGNIDVISVEAFEATIIFLCNNPDKEKRTYYSMGALHDLVLAINFICDPDAVLEKVDNISRDNPQLSENLNRLYQSMQRLKSESYFRLALGPNGRLANINFAGTLSANFRALKVSSDVSHPLDSLNRFENPGDFIEMLEGAFQECRLYEEVHSTQYYSGALGSHISRLAAWLNFSLNVVGSKVSEVSVRDHINVSVMGFNHFVKSVGLHDLELSEPQLINFNSTAAAFSKFSNQYVSLAEDVIKDLTGVAIKAEVLQMLRQESLTDSAAQASLPSISDTVNDKFLTLQYYLLDLKNNAFSSPPQIKTFKEINDEIRGVLGEDSFELFANTKTYLRSYPLLLNVLTTIHKPYLANVMFALAETSDLPVNCLRSSDVTFKEDSWETCVEDSLSERNTKYYRLSSEVMSGRGDKLVRDLKSLSKGEFFVLKPDWFELAVFESFDIRMLIAYPALCYLSPKFISAQFANLLGSFCVSVILSYLEYMRPGTFPEELRFCVQTNKVSQNPVNTLLFTVVAQVVGRHLLSVIDDTCAQSIFSEALIVGAALFIFKSSLNYLSPDLSQPSRVNASLFSQRPSNPSEQLVLDNDANLTP